MMMEQNIFENTTKRQTPKMMFVYIQKTHLNEDEFFCLY